jgi:hypothetical protein
MIRTALAVWVVLAVSGQSVWAIGTPAQTIRRAQAGKKIEPEWITTTGTKGVEVLPCPFKVKDIPAPLAKLRRLENTNSRYQDPNEFDGDIEMSILGPYDPINAKVFYVPYIPIPADQFSEYLVAEKMPPELKRVVFFKYQGKDYARYFIHPSKTYAYEDLINKYGIVRDEFVGFPGASPRSLYVWDPADETVQPFVAKVSLHYIIDGNLRTNPPPKAARSFFVNSLFESIPQDVKDEYGFDYVPEVAQLLPKGKATATIYRVIPPEFLDTSRTFVMGYYMSSVAPGSEADPQLVSMLSGVRDKPTAAPEILRPFLRSHAYLQFVERMEGEPHEQNEIFEMVGGKIRKTYYKDLDSFRVDIEARIRQGLPVDSLSKIFKPLIHAKFSKASGWGAAEGVTWDQVAYMTYIKKTFGFSFAQVLGFDKDQIRRMNSAFDLIMAQETTRITGLPVNVRTLSVASEEVPSGLNITANLFRQILNETVNYSQLPDFWKRPAVQRALREQFLSLRADRSRRASALLAQAASEDVYFILHGTSIIEARWIDPDTLAEEAVGFASLFPAEHPKTIAFQARLARLAESMGLNPKIALAQNGSSSRRPGCRVKLSKLLGGSN